MLRRFSPLPTFIPTLVSVAMMLCAPAAGEEPYGRFQFDESDRDHWAFLSPKRPEVPAVKDTAWVRNPIDAFVLARLEEEKLTPNPPADRLTLLRRVYLDLIGLLPTPAEQDAFWADNSSVALERVVDDLLARPEYGERWGRHWLDVVRYAESNGYERDGAKPSAWRYRDYVINAFNADKPYDRFLTEQLAGDELPDANAETCIATTFLRLGPWDDEPADALVDRYDQLDDVLGTTSATFTALSLRSARCHDHKFESFTQRDYTRMLAVFEPLKRPQEGRTDLDRMVGTEAELSAYQAASRVVDEQMAALRGERDRAEWELSKRLADAGMLRTPAGRAVLATSREQPQMWRYTEEAPPDTWQQTSFDAASWQEGPGGFGTEGTPGTAVRTRWASREIWLRREFELSAEALAADEPALVSFAASRRCLRDLFERRAGGEGRRFYGRVQIAADIGRGTGRAHSWPQHAGRALRKPPAASTSTWAWLRSTRRPRPPGAGPRLWPRCCQRTPPTRFSPSRRRNAKQHEMVKKFRPKLKQLLDRCASDAEKQSFTEIDRRLGDADKSRPAPLPSAYIWFEESPESKLSHVWKRGNPRDSIEEVSAGFPAILVDAPPPPPTPTAKSTGRRRQLAAWLTRPDHPLTARVWVNRIWQHHFGDGLVGSENDFGVMGEMPTHPELLDWLASELVAGGWRLKPLHRLIVLSNTYQMSSDVRPAVAARDPADDLLWRYPARRLEAEAVRDCVLETAGTLNRERGGPSVYPAISPEVLASQSKPGNGWGKSDAAQAARRSIYVFVKRTLLVPELEVLDFPDTNGTCEQRVVSTVAPQALTWFNGAFIRDQAQSAGRATGSRGGERRSCARRTGVPPGAGPTGHGCRTRRSARVSSKAGRDRRQRFCPRENAGGEAGRRPATSAGRFLPGAAQRQRVRVFEIKFGAPSDVCRA